MMRVCMPLSFFSGFCHEVATKARSSVACSAQHALQLTCRCSLAATLSLAPPSRLPVESATAPPPLSPTWAHSARLAAQQLTGMLPMSAGEENASKHARKSTATAAAHSRHTWGHAAVCCTDAPASQAGWGRRSRWPHAQSASPASASSKFSASSCCIVGASGRPSPGLMAQGRHCEAQWPS